MAFALGVAIGNLFRRIADLLNSGGLPSISPIPGGSGGSGSTNGSGSGDTPLPPPTEGPGTGPEPEPPFIPPIVSVPTVNQFPTGPGDPGYCPPLQSVDMDVLANLPNLLPSQLLPESRLIIAPPQEESELVQVSGNGTVVQDEDFFRFRAFGSAGAVPVTFFGRVADPSGNIRPFSHVLTTDADGTVFETTPRPGRGMLLGTAASVPLNSITTGAVNAIAEIGRFAGTEFIPHTLLLAGQLDDFQPLSSTLASPAPAVIRPTFFDDSNAASVATPKSMIVTPTPGRRVRFTRIEAQITCSATVLARACGVAFIAGGVSRWRGYPQALLTASQLGQVHGNLSAQQNATTNNLGDNGPLLNTPLPPDLYFYEEVTVQVFIQNNAGGDRVSDMFIRWEES